MNATAKYHAAILVAVGIAGAGASAAASELPPSYESKYPNITPPEVTLGVHAVDLSRPDDLISPRGAVFLSDDELLVADCAKNRLQLYRIAGSQAEAVKSLGGYGDGPGEFRCPTALARDDAGSIYVFDSGNHRVQIFDEERDAWRSFGKAGREPGQFGSANILFNPHGLAVRAGRIYVSDPGNHRVQIFDTDGTFLSAFGRKGTGDGEFVYPGGVDIDESGNVYVADMYNHRILKFTGDGSFIAKWGAFGSYQGDFAAPATVSHAVGELVVTDAVNHRVQVFGTDGAYLYQFARHPNEHHVGNGRTHYPMVSAASPSGRRIAICEKFEGRCQVFDRQKIKQTYRDTNDSAWWEKYPYFHYRTSAQILREIPGRPRESADGKPEPEWLVMSEEELHRVVFVDLNDSENTYAFGSRGTEPGQFNLPQGAHMDPQGRIWVSDTLNDRLQLLTIEGEVIRIVGEAGSGPGQFNQPGEVVIDTKGTVYVLDAGNGRVQVLDSEGKFLRQIGEPGMDEGQLNFPIGLALDEERGILYLTELYLPRVQSFYVDGRFRKRWGEYGTEPGHIILGCHPAVDKFGNVYVTDDALNRITKFDAEGNLLKVWGRLGTGPGEFYHPQGIAIDSKDRIWVLDYGNHRGQVFDLDGNFIAFFGEGAIASDRLLPAPGR